MFGALAGGIGLFLLGMKLMTDGLRLAAGPALERILANSTRTRVRGLASGMLVTAVVQSSSAVTVAAIGFVNAGLLNLPQALWVLFGANVGTTMTGWLVAMVGLQFKIEALALPLIGLGMLLRLSGEGKRRDAFGAALAGFGVLFLGIELLKETFSGLSTDLEIPTSTGFIAVLAQVLIGIVLTVVMQSSSAALAIALTAAQGGLLDTQGAAAVVIGANIGTTVTALVAAIGATPNAKRAAAAHIAFNLLTGMVALLLLPWLVDAIGLLRIWLGIDEAPAAQLALFHTVFNILGIILMWPLAARLTHFLQARFRAAEEDKAQPRHLDKTILAVPALALDALQREIERMGDIALHIVRAAFEPGPLAPNRNHEIVARLSDAIAKFIAQLNRASMSADHAARLPGLLRRARYYERAAQLAREAAEATHEAGYSTMPAVDGTYTDPRTSFYSEALALMSLIDPAAPARAPAIDAALRRFLDAYQTLKAHRLEAGVRGRLQLSAMDAELRAASALRRAGEQVTKAVLIQDPNQYSGSAFEPGDIT